MDPPLIWLFNSCCRAMEFQNVYMTYWLIVKHTWTFCAPEFVPLSKPTLGFMTKVIYCFLHVTFVSQLTVLVLLQSLICANGHLKLRWHHNKWQSHYICNWNVIANSSSLEHSAGSRVFCGHQEVEGAWQSAWSPFYFSYATRTSAVLVQP